MAECVGCSGSRKSLTQEGLCAFCYKNKFGKWSQKFMDHADKDK